MKCERSYKSRRTLRTNFQREASGSSENFLGRRAPANGETVFSCALVLTIHRLSHTLTMSSRSSSPEPTKRHIQSPPPLQPKTSRIVRAAVINPDVCRRLRFDRPQPQRWFQDSVVHPDSPRYLSDNNNNDVNGIYVHPAWADHPLTLLDLFRLGHIPLAEDIALDVWPESLID
jgi:hypothetical protein